ncbi:MAG: GTP 3',8-cyclase MoaA [Ponticaulis sp.]|nr:GTP 3',8-cyclase MoaA [Ponticaulis sp.]|tara:strand:+ start:12508 stop:13539 length:1032 start_codon:yes stop_codon:yes gene_type:complete
MADGAIANNSAPLIDQFGRHITYLRLSVTDRCDLRCSYCMSEHMTFLPKKDLLTLEELEHISNVFIDRGVRKIRITGGEPLVRRDIQHLFTRLGGRLSDGLEELTLTTNATLLEHHAQTLFDAGVRRINVSLDTINPDRFREITRRGNLDQVLRGLDVADQIGLKIKLNAVALKHQNCADLPEMISWAHGKGWDITLIEVMPLGDTGEDRFDQYIPLTEVRDQLSQNWTLNDLPSDDINGGPSRYSRVAETGGRLGFISPLTNNFCAGCNRVRITCTGRIYMCLGQNDCIDLRAALRESDDPTAALNEALDAAMINKPERHEFEIKKKGAAPHLDRHMSTTGG